VLILALGAVVVGCAFLVVSFLTENTAWAWGCIGACGLAAVVLVVDTIRRGRAPRTSEPVPAESPPAAETEPVPTVDAGAATEVAPLAGIVSTKRAAAEQRSNPAAETDAEQTQVLPASAGEATHSPSADDQEPDEEDIDAADVLVVGGLATEVLVVDEHPRFHLPSCSWLGGRPTLPLPVSEALELGFTGCARCTPATVLAARSRAR